MILTAQLPKPSPIEYPECDGKPLADNTKQLDWILKLVGNLKILVHDRPDVFAAGNQNWYPVKGEPEICQAPDAYVVFGRPKGDRPSWKQWEENDTPMTVVFEVLSPGNTYKMMANKLAFYDDYGVEEYYIYDPETNYLDVFVRSGVALPRVRGNLHNFASPRLGIRFDFSGMEMVVRFPDGRPFLSMEELEQVRLAAEQWADDAQQRAERLAELSLKLLAGQASEEEKQELARLAAAP